MVAQIITATVIGIDAYRICVEVDLNLSLPSIVIVGLPDTAVSEAKERVRSAIKNAGFVFPNKKVIINLAPADIKKEGTNYDLPIAIGILAEGEMLDAHELETTAFIGELSLDGSLRGVNGILPIVAGLKNFGVEKIIIPAENAKEAAIIPNIKIFPAQNLAQVVEHLQIDSQNKLKPFSMNANQYLSEKNDIEPLFDFKDVKGQQKAKRALEIAAAGAHNLLMMGSPGSGKTLLSKCFASILPPLELEEAIELTKIYSVSGLLKNDNPLIVRRPFRSVHHSASAVSIIGGGSNPKPGEITLAHKGVLFLDEIVEFPRSVLEVLRQPLEDNEVIISRAQISIKYPADFMLLGAMNPCPCGFLGDSQKICSCSEFNITRYRQKLSGPLLDRIDMQIEVPRLSSDELLNKNFTAESSADIRKRVIAARKIQMERYKDEIGSERILTNSQLSAKLVKKYCKLDEKSETLLKSAIIKFNLSGRAYDRILKLSRTVADLDGAKDINANHIAQTLQYKNFVQDAAVSV